MFKFLNGLLTVVLMLLITAAVVFGVVHSQFDRAGPLQYATTVVIPKGEGVNSITERLVKEGVLRDRWLFRLAVMKFRVQRKLKAGEYQIAGRASVRQVLDTLIDGKAILHRVTIPEGRTSYEIVEILNTHAMLTGEIGEVPAEGSMLPDTYSFSRGTARQDIIARMQSEHAKFAARLWQNRQSGLPYNSLEEAVVMASIVEKETGRPDERDQIAGVFVNRLRKRIRLQSDPTIIYGITLGRGPLGRGIRRSEIDRKTAYNTYQIDGLPPKPICNPGRSALEAALAPKPTDALYFVADGTGGHVFATTLKQHNSNVQKWRKIERALKAKRLKAQQDDATDS